MSQNIQNKGGKQPIFTYDPPKNIPKPSTQTLNFPTGGRSAAISSMIKKTEIDLISLDKNPFGNYRTLLPNNPTPKESSSFNDGNIMGKVEELVIKKLTEYKEIFATEFRKNLGSMIVSEDEKKDIKFLKENFKIQQSNTDQIISHINQFTQALNEINLLMSSHSEILNKVNLNSPSDKGDQKNKTFFDDASLKPVEGKIKLLETQMSETRSMLKQMNESLLVDIKENFKKNLTKIENDQESFKHNLKDFHREVDKAHQEFLEDLKETKTTKENTLDPKWGEKVMKIEADLDLIIRRNQGLEKKMDDFFLFKHQNEINEVNDKYEELKLELSKLTEKITNVKSVDSPEKVKSKNEILLSPQKNENLPIIDDERFNSIIEKTKRNIELALSNSPLKYENLEKNIFESPTKEIKNEKPEVKTLEVNTNENIIKKVDDWHPKYTQDKLNLESDLAFRPEIKNEYQKIEDFSKVNFEKEEKRDLSMKLTHSDGKDNSKFEPRAFLDDEKFLQRKKSDEDLNRQLKMSYDDYQVAYMQNDIIGSNQDEIKNGLPEFEGMKLTFTESAEQPKEIPNETNITLVNKQEEKMNLEEKEPEKKEKQDEKEKQEKKEKQEEKENQEDITPTNDEIVYHLDEEGFLMDENGNYIVDENEQMIKLSEEHIDYLRKSNMIEDDKNKNDE